MHAAPSSVSSCCATGAGNLPVSSVANVLPGGNREARRNRVAGRQPARSRRALVDGMGATFRTAPRRLPPSWRGGRLGPGDPHCGRAPGPPARPVSDVAAWRAPAYRSEAAAVRVGGLGSRLPGAVRESTTPSAT